MTGLVRMLDMAGNTIHEQQRMIEALQQEVVRLNGLVDEAGQTAS